MALARHANATLLDAVGTPLGTVQDLLGHSSAEVTREIYLHCPAEARKAVQRVETLLIGPKWTQVADRARNGGSSNSMTFLGLNWSGREDLNLRPPGPEPGALPG